jgi:hypothetical protein
MAISTITKGMAWAASVGVLPWWTIRNLDGTGTPIVVQMAAEVIPYPSTYAGGPKPARVQKFGQNSRTLSDIKGRSEAAAMSITVADPTGVLRAWFTDARLRNAFGLEVSIDFSLTTDRLNGIAPAPNWHGLIKSYRALAGGLLQFDSWDLLASLSTTTVPQPRLGDFFRNAPSSSLDLPGRRFYGHWSDEPASGGGPGTPTQWQSAVSLSTFNADFTLPTDGLLTLYNSGDQPCQIQINGVTKGEVVITQGHSVSMPYSAGQTAHFITSSGSGLLAWFFGLVGDTWGAEVPISLDVDFSNVAHGMLLLYNPGSQGGIYTLGGVDYAEVVSSFTFPVPGTGASANAPYLAGLTGHVTTAGGSGLVATLYPFTNGSTWSAPTTLPIDGSVFTPSSDGLVQLYDAGNETGTYTMAGTSFAQANEVYHMAVGAPYQNGQTATITPWGGSGLLAWFFALNGSAPTPSTAPAKGMVPLINVGGPWVDLTGQPWALAFEVSANAVKGNFTLYSRDSSGLVTPLAALDDTQISAPGRTGFVARWGATPYRVINGRPWTLVYATDALAMALAAGTVSLWANFDGVESVGDSSGTLLTRLADQAAHVWDNEIGPLALGLPVYAGGPWAAAIPAYGDGRASRNATSFSNVLTFNAAVLPADVGVWALTAPIACADLISFLATECDCAQGFDDDGALVFVGEPPNPAAPIRSDLPLTEALEIEKLSLSWEDQVTPDHFFNQLTYTWAPTFDASGTLGNPQTFTLTNTAGVSNARGLTITSAENLIFFARRDTATVLTLATRLMARAAPAPRDARVSTGLFGVGGAGYKFGDLVPVSSPDGAGAGGWSGELLQVRSITTDWDAYRVSLGVRGTAVNDSEIVMLAAVTWFFGGSEANPLSNAAYATGDVRLPDSNKWLVDSTNLLGTYAFELDGYSPSGALITVGLFNLDDAPNVPIAEASFSNTTRDRAVSVTILSAGVGLAAPGVAKNYGIKAKIASSTGFVFSVRVRRAS